MLWAEAGPAVVYFHGTRANAKSFRFPT